jgi:hypothetical protein
MSPKSRVHKKAVLKGEKKVHAIPSLLHFQVGRTFLYPCVDHAQKEPGSMIFRNFWTHALQIMLTQIAQLN